MGLLHKIDVTFWNKDGHSAFGLTRTQAKWLGLFFIFIGAMFLSPPIDPIPNDWMNMLLAGQLHNWFPSLGYNLWLVFTYVPFGPLLILFGIWIYPYNTQSLLNGYINKAKTYIRKAFSKPVYILIGILMFIALWYVYTKIIGVKLYG